jgi:LL-diaminopimelate aminotransferase
MKRNSGIAQLKTNYLFPEINLRKRQFLLENPQVNLISLGIGDTTEPIPLSIAQALSIASSNLATASGYSGYGPEQGMQALRKKISSKIYSHSIEPDEIFISDGAKCDLGRLQTLFGRDISIAVQDPTYPVYLEGSLIQGITDIVYMPCVPENDFFPVLENTPRADLIYFCSPNNPTGAAASRSQLEKLVAFAIANDSLIIYDAAYANYIQDPSIPKSIFEIENAKKTAIEINSFSKLAGFTGIRLGWTVVPRELQYEDGHSVRDDWNRLTSTIFNGASNIAQYGGSAVLEDLGLQEVAGLTNLYLENAAIIREALEQLNYPTFGGVNAPYVWVKAKEKKSWDAFQFFLEKYHIVTTPGSGFGFCGEGFIRFSAFGHRSTIEDAVGRLKKS